MYNILELTKNMNMLKRESLIVALKETHHQRECDTLHMQSATVT